jgi:hypothetical protein
VLALVSMRRRGQRPRPQSRASPYESAAARWRHALYKTSKNCILTSPRFAHLSRFAQGHKTAPMPLKSLPRVPDLREPCVAPRAGDQPHCPRRFAPLYAPHSLTPIGIGE